MVFILSALKWIRIRGLWKLSDGRDCLRGELGLVLMGGFMLSKSLIQFSADGWSCVPSLWFDLRPNYGGGNEDDGDLLQKAQGRHCHTQCPHPCSRPLSTHTSTRDSWILMGWVSLLWGYCSIPLGPGAHKVLFVSSKSLFPLSCVSSGSSVVGLTVTCSKRACTIPRSAAPRAPASKAGHD